MDLSQERKHLQYLGDLPEWMTTQGWQIIKKKYLSPGETYRQRLKTIAKVAASHTNDPIHWEPLFFQDLWNGWLSPATPVLANMGTNKGMVVSCAGSYVGDSLDEIYKTKHEVAMLTKNGFGTSGYLGGIRGRGELINKSFPSSGVTPVVQGFVKDMQYIHQGAQRRGAFASYVDIDHPDMEEICQLLPKQSDDMNIGWVVKQSFIDKLNAGDITAIRQYQLALQAKCQSGKGYFWFADKAHNHMPEVYKQHGLQHKASNLCTEIVLPSDEDHTFTCVLSSVNLAKYDEWKDSDLIYRATVFLDCVCSEFIRQATGKAGLEKAVRFTYKFRALGLGVMGFHTYLQKQGWTWGSLDTMYFNREVFKRLREDAERASAWMAKAMGTSLEMAGTGRRNASLLAIAPTLSTSLIMGGVSPGIEPVAGNAFIQSSAAGEMERINPEFLALLKRKGMYTPEVIQQVSEAKGSCQDLEGLTDEEKQQFLTAFELDQHTILRLAAQRQQFIDQGQSLNLFVDADASEEYVSELHQEAFTNPGILGLYYLRTQAGVTVKAVCESCAS